MARGKADDTSTAARWKEPVAQPQIGRQETTKREPSLQRAVAAGTQDHAADDAVAVIWRLVGWGKLSEAFIAFIGRLASSHLAPRNGRAHAANWRYRHQRRTDLRRAPLTRPQRTRVDSSSP